MDNVAYIFFSQFVNLGDAFMRLFPFFSLMVGVAGYRICIYSLLNDLVSAF